MLNVSNVKYNVLASIYIHKIALIVTFLSILPYHYLSVAELIHACC